DDPDHPMRAWVTNLDASPYVGRLAVCRVEHGTIRKGQAIAWCREDGSIESARVGTLTVTEALDQVDVDEAGPGELIGNVSIRVLPTERPDAWEVQGRGELQLAVLVETMRREGFELTIGKPEVLTQEIDGTLHEPTERLTVDVPEEHVGAVTQLLGARKATMENMANHGTGWVRLDYVVPARALIGFRTEFLTETRGTGMLHHVFEGWTPWAGEIRTRDRGSVVADRTGQSTGYAIQSLQERTALYVAPGEQVYEGMVVGENSRNEDMDVNICREKAKTNIRTQSSDDTIRLTPPKVFSLEQALESIADDECVEVTPETVRIRKTVLDAGERARILKKQKHPRD
ncbi:MAG: translational GTPase TypA, partial [Actinobacteria bacterium]|nr:translational GTPase TypA [Actinomycetota bacterium]